MRTPRRASSWRTGSCPGCSRAWKSSRTPRAGPRRAGTRRGWWRGPERRGWGMPPGRAWYLRAFLAPTGGVCVPFRLSFFSVLILTSTVLGHVYLYRRLVRDTVRRVALRRLALAVFVLMSVPLMFRRHLRDILPESLEEPVSVVSYAWMGVALFLVLALLVWDLGRALWKVGRKLRAPEAPPVDEDRRRVLARPGAGGGGGGGRGFGGGGDGRLWELACLLGARGDRAGGANPQAAQGPGGLEHRAAHGHPRGRVHPAPLHEI